MSDQVPGPADGRSQRDRMLAGELYIADDPQLAADNLRALTLASQFNASDPAGFEARLALLGELLGSVGEGTEIRPPLYCDYGYQTHIGARTFINFGCVLLDVASITIGDDVQVGPNVQFLTPTHPVDAEPRRAKWEAAKPITVGDNVWLGGGVIVCPGGPQVGHSHAGCNQPETLGLGEYHRLLQAMPWEGRRYDKKGT